ncbi:MAG: type II toxin-antitoxin system prevent-host-death family antitoxin [Gammaproteobacteria bacterium]|nr:type II toxin-antitoxin system prevent-host-death family antitoxin [Gammaproteobacteria bacterium]MDE0302241.1 type II toxin-antitoxin system prevent-host-death family antitoxin [Gammaproteobacteria bacterium]
MPVVDIHAARAQLSSLLTRVEAGEEIVIARDGKPIAKLVCCGHFGKRQFGALKGRISIDDRFFDPLPETELAAWGQGNVTNPI